MVNETLNYKPALWGGRCPEAQILALAKAWAQDRDLPYRIWEMASAIRFEKVTFPADEDLPWLERARLFGKAGDLSLRRDGQLFRWWFVGPTGAELPALLKEMHPEDGITCRDFWTVEPKGVYTKEEGQALLWGERLGGTETPTGQYFEDRVASADLSYPVTQKWPRVHVNYVTFSRAGRVEFTWLQDLAEAAKNDGRVK